MPCSSPRSFDSAIPGLSGAPRCPQAHRRLSEGYPRAGARAAGDHSADSSGSGCEDGAVHKVTRRRSGAVRGYGLWLRTTIEDSASVLCGIHIIK